MMTEEPKQAQPAEPPAVRERAEETFTRQQVIEILRFHEKDIHNLPLAIAINQAIDMLESAAEELSAFVREVEARCNRGTFGRDRSAEFIRDMRAVLKEQEAKDDQV